MVLGDNKVVEANELDELAKNVMLPPLIAVDDDHASVEVVGARNAEDLLHVFGADRNGSDDGILNGGYVFVADVDVEELGDVADDGGVAVDIDRFGILGEFIGNDEAVIGREGIVVTNRKLGDEVFEIGLNVIKGDVNILGRHAADDRLGGLADVRVENVYIIDAPGRGICN